VFGDTAWGSSLAGDQAFPILCAQVLAAYKSRLRDLPKVRYTFAFEMRTRADTLNYYLVFASQHPLGLEKMKEAMRRIDQTGDYCFTDARTDQPKLFRFDQPEEWSSRLLERFQGVRASYHQLHDFALNETPFTNPKGMLKDLEMRNPIQVVSTDPKRRKGTFKEEKIRYIQFPQGGSHGQQDQY
jgi:hypothetical protein